MNRQQVVQSLAATFDTLTMAAGMVQPTAEWGAYQLATDQALRQLGVAEDSLSDDSQVTSQPGAALWTLAQYYTLQQIARGLALQVDVRVTNSAASGVDKKYSQLYKNVADQLALLRKDAMEMGVLPAFESGQYQLDIFEPMQGMQPSTGWWGG
jgi:hypothetical protein